MTENRRNRRAEAGQTRPQTRRVFMKNTVAGAVASGLLGRRASSRPTGNISRASRPVFTPAGELRTRIEMTQDRLTRDGVPSFSVPFILADVSLDPGYPRRFSNYSGDLSGRYIGALALMPPERTAAPLDTVVRRAIRFQRADGRFGDPTLSFSPRNIGREQMALLWGNGRLLVGLLEYNSVHRDAGVLDASRRLAEFLLKVQESCARTEVMRRLVGQGASGFICFTQLIEAFALLGLQTGEHRYYEAAARIIPWLQPRGNQHSHGFLTTLRGIVQLSQASGEAEYLRSAESAYRDLIASSDYTIYGGVCEYFGSGPGDSGAEQGRDEGCSEADFVRLGLQLWQATGRMEYLERAERCLLNEFFFNQFNTGDFGHHAGYRYGYKPTESVGRAWWCCTMHGLRAFRDVVEAIVTAKDDSVRINLFLDGSWIGEQLALDLEMIESAAEGAAPRFRITTRESSSGEVSLAIRRPGWASEQNLLLNGSQIASQSAGGYLTVKRTWRKGDVLDVDMHYRFSLLTRTGTSLSPADLTNEAIEAAIFCGPYLLAADGAGTPAFLVSRGWETRQPTATSSSCRARRFHPRRTRTPAAAWPDPQHIDVSNTSTAAGRTGAPLRCARFRSRAHTNRRRLPSGCAAAGPDRSSGG